VFLRNVFLPNVFLRKEFCEMFSAKCFSANDMQFLFNAYEFGSSGSAVLPTLFKLGKQLSDSDYKNVLFLL
jgi:hypothetical protein